MILSHRLIAMASMTILGCGVLFIVSCGSGAKKTETISVPTTETTAEPVKTTAQATAADLGAASAGRSR